MHKNKGKINMFKRKKDNREVMMCFADDEILFENVEGIYGFVGMLLSKRDVDACPIKNGSIIFDKKTKKIYHIVNPTKDKKGIMRTIDMRGAKIKDVLNEVIRAAEDFGLIIEDDK